jgi:hypothetical protein
MVMTTPKKHLIVRGDRPPAYVSRETGAAELCISPETWDRWAVEDKLPRAAAGSPPGSPRWRWEDVDRKISGRGEMIAPANAYLAGIERIRGPKKESRREAA